MAVVVVYDAYSKIGDLLAEGIELARARRSRLEVIAVVSPLRALFIGYGLAYAAVSQKGHEYDLSFELDRYMYSVPADVPVRSRILRGSRRRVRREVAALAPVAVVGTPRYGVWPGVGAVPSPSCVSNVDNSTVKS